LGIVESGELNCLTPAGLILDDTEHEQQFKQSRNRDGSQQQVGVNSFGYLWFRST
jgi:hypothetical protein